MRSAVAFAVAVYAALAVSVSAHGQAANILDATLAETDAKTPEISTRDMRKIVAEGGALILDTRTRAEFVAGHIPGAHLLDAPADQLGAAVERLAGGDKGRALVLYCNGPHCQASRRVGEQLAKLGFVNVRRYQLGMPVWRALGGPTQIELEGIVRLWNVDRTAVFFDARSSAEFARGSIPGARNIPPEKLASGATQGVQMPEEDFNTRIILFGRDAGQARALAEALSRRPWHNVSYFAGSWEALAAALKGK